MLRRLVDFAAPDDVAAWQAIDDVVMGGVSRSTLQQAAPGIARFAGVVSMDRGGGFASVRTEPRAWPAAGAVAFALHCRGDGHTYKFTVRTEDSFDGVQYQHRFAPTAGTWDTVRLAVADFVPSFRGRTVAGAPPLDAARVRQLGLMISDRQPGPFELLLDWIAVSAETD